MAIDGVRQRAQPSLLGLAVCAIAFTGSPPASAERALEPGTAAGQAALPEADSTTGDSPSASKPEPDTTEESHVSRARNAAIAGLEAFDQGRYADAEVKLVEAYGLVKVPTLALYLARAYERLGKWVEALQYFDEAQTLAVDRGDESTQVQAQADAYREGEALRARVPRLRVRLEGATEEPIEASVDGKVVGRELLERGYPVNPGWRQIVVKQGNRVVRDQVHAQVGQVHVLVLRLEQPAREQRNTQAPDVRTAQPRQKADNDWRPLGWTSVGIGVAGLGVGTAAGVWALTLRGMLKDHCPDKDCPPQYHDEVDTYRRLRTVSTAAFIVGGIGVAGGVTLLLQDRDSQKLATRLRIGVSWNQASVSGSF